MAEERDSLAGKCYELTLEVCCMPVLVEEAKSLRARVAEMEDASERMALKVPTKDRTADTSVTA